MTAKPLRFALPRGECHGFMCHTRAESPPATEATNMNATTKTTLEMARTLARRGFAVRGIEIQTPDGRCWCIDTVAAGRVPPV
jgi:hypothetical protein